MRPQQEVMQRIIPQEDWKAQERGPNLECRKGLVNWLKSVTISRDSLMKSVLAWYIQKLVQVPSVHKNDFQNQKDHISVSFYRWLVLKAKCNIIFWFSNENQIKIILTGKSWSNIISSSTCSDISAPLKQDIDYLFFFFLKIFQLFEESAMFYRK